ncbi:MAG: aromatic ring-hydroxylating dioxygenase subunit alpha [Acidimicrobiia bacterium]
MASGIPDLPVLYAEHPIERYRDPARYEAELRTVFTQHWLVATRVESLPRRGALPVTVAGRGLVLTRDGDTVRAFHNVCSHRAAEVVEGCTESARLRCGYHGWTYGLDGRLVAVPGRARFGPDLDVESCGLPPVHAEAWGGWVWVHLGTPAADVATWLEGFADEVDRYRGEDQRVYGTRTERVGLNWKAAVDAFNETYHVAYIHPQTVGRLVTAKHTWFTYAGPHSRSIIPVTQTLSDAQGRSAGAAGRRVKPELLPEQAEHHANYTFFPNVIANMLPTWGVTIVFDPVSHWETDLKVWMTADPPRSERQEHGLEAQWVEFCKVLDEDLHFVGTVGRGMRSEAARTLRLGGEEEKLVRFHRLVDAAADADLARRGG